MSTCALAIALMVLIAPGNTWGQGEPKQAAAQALFDEGLRLFKDGRYDDACSKFEASLELFEAMGTRGKLGECYEKLGRTASAWAAYREVAVLAKRAGQHRRQQVAAERAARLEKILSYLTIDVPDDARVPGLKITRDGILVSAGAYATPIAVDPGAQTITATAEGYERWSSELDVPPSESRSVEIPALGKRPGGDLVEVHGSRGTERNTKKIVGMAAVGVGGAGVVASLVLGLKAKSDYDGAFDDGLCDDQRVCSPDGSRITQDARSLADVATIVGVSGAVIAGVGAYLWLTTGDAGETRGVNVAPAVDDSSLRFTLYGRF